MAIFGHFWSAVFEAQKRGFYFVDALLFYFVKIHFVDAFLSRFLKIDGISLCRRNSPENRFVDAFIQYFTLSTHFFRKTFGIASTKFKNGELWRLSWKTENCVHKVRFDWKPNYASTKFKFCFWAQNASTKWKEPKRVSISAHQKWPKVVLKQKTWTYSSVVCWKLTKNERTLALVSPRS